jgi:hypothetical protein
MIYPPVNIQFANLNMAIEIVDLPSYERVMFQRVLYVYQRVNYLLAI